MVGVPHRRLRLTVRPAHNHEQYRVAASLARAGRIALALSTDPDYNQRVGVR